MLHAALAEDLGIRGQPPDLSGDDILEWADAYHETDREWPTSRAGVIPETPGESWLLVEAAITLGKRGFAGGTTLLRFLAANWMRPCRSPEDLTIENVLAWADAWYARTGRRPIAKSGEIPGTGGITWRAVDSGRREGRTNRPSGLSLERLQVLMRGVYRPEEHPDLNLEQILGWADVHFARNPQ